MSKLKIIAIDESGSPVSLSIAQLLAELTTIEVGPIMEGTEPVVGGGPVQEPKQVFGYPRTLVGYRISDDTPKTGNPIYVGTGVTGLIEVLNESPDTIIIRGYNLDYKTLSGIKRPAGPSSGWYGVEAPEGTVDPSGYSVKTFPNSKVKQFTQL